MAFNIPFVGEGVLYREKYGNIHQTESLETAIKFPSFVGQLST
jgi:hypothetical protein